MRPAFNFELKYRVTMMTRENGQEELGLLMYLKGSSGVQMGPG
jgi:hypothetical protein